MSYFFQSLSHIGLSLLDSYGIERYYRWKDYNEFNKIIVRVGECTFQSGQRPNFIAILDTKTTMQGKS